MLLKMQEHLLMRDLQATDVVGVFAEFDSDGSGELDSDEFRVRRRRNRGRLRAGGSARGRARARARASLNAWAGAGTGTGAGARDLAQLSCGGCFAGGDERPWGVPTARPHAEAV